MSACELKKHRFNRTHPECRDATIPILREACELLKPTGRHINTEWKTSRRRCLEKLPYASSAGLRALR